MSSSGGSFLGKLLTFFLGMIFGMIVLVGGLAGGAYWAVTKLKVSTIENKFSLDIFGDDYKGQTLMQLFNNIKSNSSTLTLGEFEEMFKILQKQTATQFPSGAIDIKLAENATLAQIDLDALRASTIKNLPQAIKDALTITATLRTLTAMGINMPSLPVILGDEDTPVDVYTLATSETAPFDVKKSYLDQTEFYKQTTSYILTTVEDGKIAGANRYKDKFFIIDPLDASLYIQADDSGGNVVDNYPSGTDFYIENLSYTLADDNDLFTQALYVKSNGIIDLPITDGFGALANLFNFEQLTLNDLQTNFGVTLGSNFMLDRVRDVPINKLSSGINDEIDNIELKDIITDDGSNQIITAILYKDAAKTQAVKVKEISARVNELVLKDIMTIDLTSPQILQSLQDTKLTELSTAFSTLTIEQMTNVSGNNILQAIKHATLDTLPDAINALTLQDVAGGDIYDGFEQIYVANGTFDKAKHSFKAIYTFDGVTYTQVEKSDLFDINGDLAPAYIGENLYAGKVKAGMWKYLVMDSGEEVAVSINSLGGRMEAVAINISQSTLNDLHTNGIIIFTNPADAAVLGKTIIGSSDTIGSMNISEILSTLNSSPLVS